MRDPDARRDRLHAAGPWVLDGLLALAAAGAGVALLATVLPFDPGSPRAWTAYLLVPAYTMPIAVRRLFPLPALAWALATGAAFAALGLNLVTLSFAILVYVYTVAASCPRRVALAGLAATEALLALIWLARPGWRRWPPRWPGPGCGSRSGSRGPRPSCQPVSTCRATGSPRRR
jgi:hypothetical protein